MSDTTSISWTQRTWNPWRGCDKVSPGCAHCYMFTDQRRYGRDPSVVQRCSPATFNRPLSKAWSEPGLVFTCSWSDWFHEDADAWRDEAWEIIRRTPHLTYQILTKRPERIAAHLPADWGDGYENVWLGVTIENRRFVDRADALRAVPAAVRFISAEPLLGPLIATGRVPIAVPRGGILRSSAWSAWPDGHTIRTHPQLFLNEIDWIIIGGESGPGARRFDEEWARALLDRAARSSTAVHVKQMGSVWARQHGVKGKAENPDEWPPDLRVREWPRALVTA
jgi:protein gp37